MSRLPRFHPAIESASKRSLVLAIAFSALAVWQWAGVLIQGPAFLGDVLAAMVEGCMKGERSSWIIIDYTVAGPCFFATWLLLRKADNRGIFLGLGLVAAQLVIVVGGLVAMLRDFTYLTLFIGPICVALLVALVGLLVPLVRSLFIIRDARGFAVQ